MQPCPLNSRREARGRCACPCYQGRITIIRNPILPHLIPDSWMHRLSSRKTAGFEAATPTDPKTRKSRIGLSAGFRCIDRTDRVGSRKRSQEWSERLPRPALGTWSPGYENLIKCSAVVEMLFLRRVPSAELILNGKQLQFWKAFYVFRIGMFRLNRTIIMFCREFLPAR